MDFMACPMCGERVPAQATFCIRCCRPFRDSSESARRASDRALHDLNSGARCVLGACLGIVTAAFLGFSPLSGDLLLFAQVVIAAASGILALFGARLLYRSWHLWHRR